LGLRNVLALIIVSTAPVTVNGTNIIDGFALFGRGISNLTASQLRNKTVTTNSSTVSPALDTNGVYTVLTAVWSYCSGEKLVAFNQTEFTKSAAGGGSSSGEGLPWQGEVRADLHGLL